MATDAQMDANRRNAARSTGPKTPQGKAKARLNALKHGRRAKATNVMPVLPHEDPRDLEERVQTWIDDWEPTNALEFELVRRAARLSWLLERGERFEAAHLAHRVRLAGRKAGPTASASARRMKVVNDLARKLFYDYQHGSLSSPLPPWDDDPAVFVAGLEDTLEGCRWLIARWHDLRALLERNAQWSQADVYRFVRLLGKLGIEAVNDLELNALFLAWEVLWEGQGKILWEMHLKQTRLRDPAMVTMMIWREIAPRPADKAKALEFILGVIDEQAGRLEQRVAEFEQIAEAEAAERFDRAAFDPSPGFERHRRHQASLGRELLRTIDTLRRLRRAEVSPSVHNGQGLLTGASASTPPTQPPGEGESLDLDHGQSICPCHPERSRGWGEGSRTEESASIPPTQLPSEVELTVEPEVHEHESATSEANSRSTQESTIMEVTSTCGSRNEDDRTQSPGHPAHPSVTAAGRSRRGVQILGTVFTVDLDETSLPANNTYRSVGNPARPQRDRPRRMNGWSNVGSYFDGPEK